MADGKSFSAPRNGQQAIHLARQIAKGRGDFALVSVIGLEEIMRQAQNAVTFAKHPFTFYMVAAVMYLGLTVLAMGTMHVLEKRAARGFVRRT